MSFETCEFCGLRVIVEGGEATARPGVSAAFYRAVERTLAHEGYFSDHQADPGGATLFGIAREKNPEAYQRVRAVLETEGRDAAVEAAKKEYYQMFWVPLLCDKLDSEAVAAELFDSGVNCGTVRAVEFAQTAANYMGHGLGIDLEVDGWMGPLTLRALNQLSQNYEVQLLAAMNGFQFMHYVALARAKPEQFGQFFRGWMQRVAA